MKDDCPIPDIKGRFKLPTGRPIIKINGVYFYDDGEAGINPAKEIELTPAERQLLEDFDWDKINPSIQKEKRSIKVSKLYKAVHALSPREMIKQNFTILGVLESKGIRLDKRGFACCPFHAEKTPSFTYDKERSRFHCFGCGIDGDVIELLALFDGVTSREFISKYAEELKHAKRRSRGE